MLQSKYITLDEFEEYFGIDLIEEFEGKKSALAFLTRIENRLESFIDSTFAKNIEFMYPQFSDYQKKHYKLALLEQAIYVFKNGDISVDSGLDENGKVFDKSDIKKSIIAPNCENELRLCGIWNRNVRSGGLKGGVIFGRY